MTLKPATLSLNRRRLLAAGAAGAALAAAGSLPTPAIAQGAGKIKMTLPWLPQGAQLYPFIARNKGFWKSRGLDVEIARGYGSGAAIQAVAQQQFQVGVVAVPTVILSAAKGLEMRSFGTAGYDSTIGVLTLEDSPIRTLKDLEGRKLGSTPTSSEVPYMTPFLERSGIDASKVDRVQLQANVLESSLINKQVDAITAFGTSNMPNLLAQGIKFRFFPMSSAKITLYSNAFLTSPEYQTKEPGVVAAWTEGLNEAVKFCMLNLDEAVDIFLKEVPEVRMSQTGAAFTRYGAGLFLATQVVPEVTQHGVGWTDMESVATQTDLVMRFVAAPGDRRPDPQAIFSNAHAGALTLTDAEWATVRRSAQEYAGYLGLSV